MSATAFDDCSKWWVYRNEAGGWDVSAPKLRGVSWAGVREYRSGVEALAAYTGGAA